MRASFMIIGGELFPILDTNGRIREAGICHCIVRLRSCRQRPMWRYGSERDHEMLGPRCHVLATEHRMAVRFLTNEYELSVTPSLY